MSKGWGKMGREESRSDLRATFLTGRKPPACSTSRFVLLQILMLTTGEMKLDHNWLWFRRTICSMRKWADLRRRVLRWASSCYRSVANTCTSNQYVPIPICTDNSYPRVCRVFRWASTPPCFHHCTFQSNRRMEWALFTNGCSVLSSLGDDETCPVRQQHLPSNR